MTLTSPGILLAQIGSISVTWYSALTFFGFLIAAVFGIRLASRNGVPLLTSMPILILTYLGALLGARIYFVCFQLPYFIQHPLRIITEWHHGRCIHGAVIGTVLTLAICCFIRKVPFRAACDVAGTCLPLGQAIGRWGNFFNSEAFGVPVPQDFPIKVYIAPPFRGETYLSSNYFHPTFLYESIWDLAIFMLLYFWCWSKLKRFPGACFLIYAGLYSAGRMIIESLRTDSIMLAGIPLATLVSGLWLLLSIIGLTLLLKFENGKTHLSHNRLANKLHRSSPHEKIRETAAVND